MKKNVMILTGAGQIGMAIARRIGYGMKIIIGDKSKMNADIICTRTRTNPKRSSANLICRLSEVPLQAPRVRRG